MFRLAQHAWLLMVLTTACVGGFAVALPPADAAGQPDHTPHFSGTPIDVLAPQRTADAAKPAVEQTAHEVSNLFDLADAAN